MGPTRASMGPTGASMGLKRASMGLARASMGPKKNQRTFEFRALHVKLSRGANPALLWSSVIMKGQMGSLSKLLSVLLVVFTILGRVGGQVALPDGKTPINFPLNETQYNMFRCAKNFNNFDQISIILPSRLFSVFCMTILSPYSIFLLD